MVRISIVGLGRMGKRIAQVCISYGHDTVLIGRNKHMSSAVAEWLMAENDKNFLKGIITEEQLFCFNKRIIIGDGLKDAFGSDILIEAISEDMDLKKKLLKELNTVLDSKTIIASNTSSLSIEEMSNKYTLKDRVVGVHFFNPAHKMKLVEVTFLEKTSPMVRIEVIKFLESINKDIVYTKDSPGFIVNRILMLMINEAYYLFHDGIASKDEIDNAMKLGCNFPLGPFELSEFIGKKVCYSILKTLHKRTGDKQFIPHPFLSILDK